MILDKIKLHVSSVSLLILTFIWYFIFDDDLYFINDFLPEKGRPLFIFMVISGVILYEVFYYRTNELSKKIDNIAHEMAVNRVKGAIGSLYSAFMMSGDEFIDNELTIREISDLESECERLGVNSYNQGKLSYLSGQIRRR